MKYRLNDDIHPLSRGFTLIELLVVISIIGFLSSIVLAVLSSARARAVDATIQESAIQMRNAYELVYTQNNSYSSLVPSASIVSMNGSSPNIICSVISSPSSYACSIYTPAGCSTMYNDQNALNICGDVVKRISPNPLNVGISGGGDPSSAYAIWIQFKSNSNYFCLRSRGTATTTSDVSPTDCRDYTKW